VLIGQLAKSLWGLLIHNVAAHPFVANILVKTCAVTQWYKPLSLLQLYYTVTIALQILSAQAIKD